MKINRLFEIVYILLDKQRVTATELAKHFEVTPRTIMRDIEILSESGVPIFTVHGKGVGISLMDGFILNKTAISEKEQNQILIALQSLKVTESLETEELLSRLGNLFDKHEENWIEVDFSSWGDRGFVDKMRFDKLRQAIVNSQAVKITYYNGSGEKTERVIYPLKLVYKDRSWYLEAFCKLRNDYRVFRLSRIKDAALEDEIFDRKKYTMQPLEQDNLKCERIVIRFQNKVFYRVYDSFDESDMIKKDAQFITVAVDMPVENSLYDFIFSFGDGAEVLSPKKVRDGVISRIKRMNDIYGLDK